MKKIISFLFLSFFFLPSSQTRTILSGWTAYTQSVNVEEKQNWKFRATAKARKESDNNSNAAIWCRIDNNDNTSSFFENQYFDTKITSEWKTYEITGIIDQNAKTLNIGAFIKDNGDFYFDDFKLEVNDSKSKKWIELPLKNNGFENNLSLENGWFEGVDYEKPTQVKNFTIETSDKKPFNGKKSLLIKGRGIIGSMPHGKYIEANGVKLTEKVSPY